MNTSKSWDLRVKLNSFTKNGGEFWYRGYIWTRSSYGDVHQEALIPLLMSRRSSKQPVSIWLSPGHAVFPQCPAGHLTVMWTSFCSLRYVRALRGEKKKKIRAVSYSRLCFIYKYTFTFWYFYWPMPEYENHIMYSYLDLNAIKGAMRVTRLLYAMEINMNV